MGKPKILIKNLYEILQSDKFDCVRWTVDGRAFIIVDPEEFQNSIMPEYFYSTQIKSLYRQLNSYGFKMRSLEMNQKQFSHKWFIKGNKSSLSKVERKRRQSIAHLDKEKDSIIIMREEMKQLKEELETLQSQQNSILKQIRIHSIIQTYICKNIKKICDEQKKYNLEREQERRLVLYFTSMFQIFKGFHFEIASNIIRELKDIGGPQTPSFSPMIFPFM
ncbi:unnamed protein product (macronuclear) [Paramecium tetraurelia]|uniref:HSF-type DNA-binding domain-containing protein n=1 Tax=Paramecium tetraurelia TaxID=5888 RepID=A0CG14_PARTE|nr:uncharacterized protein GSPATT00038174001 [Paramecium tetraurelia]CAK69731.1 unnamed protein product [Paramecium tetraurelia]|eukprot:XP_001437128.1 hypothetical protein (macronuclear) [Paramecium tetraurelia strain d4-2]